MRVSNVQIAKGSVVYAKFPDKYPGGYLQDRPLIVVSNPIPVFDQVIVCETGTKMKPGIEIRLWNYFADKAVGNAPISTIYPYCLHTIPVEYIVQTIGMIDPYIMKAVDKSIQFFTGLSEEIPEYLKYEADKCFGVSYTYANPNYICQSQRPIPEVGKKSSDMKIQKTNAVFIDEPVSAPIDNNDTELVDKPNSATPTADESPKEKDSVKPAEKTEKMNLMKPADETGPIFKTKFTGGDISMELKLNSMKTFIDHYIDIGLEDSVKSTAADFYKLYTELYKVHSWAYMTGKSFAIIFAKQMKALGIASISNGSVNSYLGIAPKNSKTVTDNDKSKTKVIRPVDMDSIPADVKEWCMTPICLPKDFEIEHVSDYGVDDYSACMIISRHASIDALRLKYVIPEEEAERLRDGVTKMIITQARDLKPKVQSNARYTQMLPEFNQLALAILYKFDPSFTLVKKHEPTFIQITNKVLEKFGVNFSNPEWSTVKL